MTDKIEVRKIENLKGSDKVRINVEIEGYSTLYFEFEGVEEIANPGDLVVLTLLTEAMLSHRDLCLPDSITVSERLLTNLEDWQDVFSCWYTQMSKVNVFANTSNLEETANKYVCSLFSGGADSLYTLYKNRNDITHLLFCYGMDIQLEEKERFNDARRLNQEVADSLSKKLVIVTTNIRHVLKYYDSKINHMTIFSAQALAFGFGKLYIPASHTSLPLHPRGSHPLTDPLLSNGTTLIRYDGQVRRSEKIEYLATTDTAIDLLRVCNASDTFNCGKCEKCLRTMFVLEVLNVKSSAIPSLSDRWRELKQLKIYSQGQLIYWQDNLAFAREHGNMKLMKECVRICRRFEIRRWIKKGINLFFDYKG